MTPLAGIALADALYAAGLAPAGVHRFTEFPHGPGDQCYLDPATGMDWEPWHSLDAVAHLVERYTMVIAQLDMPEGRAWVVGATLRGQADSRRGPFAQLPTLIGNLALALRAQEAAEEGSAP